MLIEKKILFKEVLIFLDLLLFSLLSLTMYLLNNNGTLTHLFSLVFDSGIPLTSNNTNNQAFFACLIIPPLMYLTLSLNGLFIPLRSVKLSKLLWLIIKMLLTSACLSSLLFFVKLNSYDHLYILVLLFFTAFGLGLERIIIYFILHLTHNIQYNPVNLLIVGKGKRAVQFIEKIKSKPELGYTICGVVDDEDCPTHKHSPKKKTFHSISVLGYLNELSTVLAANTIDEVVLIVPRSRLQHMENTIHFICTTYGIKVNVAADLFDFELARAHLSEIDGWHMLTFHTAPAREWQLLAKRMIDILGSLAMLFFMIIPLFIVAIIIKLTSPGPVLFIQKRVGLNGKLFNLYKFRSMYKDADQRLHEFLDKNIMNGPVFKMKDDPRVTPFGKIIRKYSIDELPQFFNVLAGQMSLVGPRPNLMAEVKNYQTWQMRRLSMRPGITCLWQINGRNNTSFDYWMKKDLKYLDEWSLGLDFKILYKTMPAVLKATGAY